MIQLKRGSVLVIFIFVLNLFPVAGCVQEKVVTSQPERAHALQNMGVSLAREGNLREGLARLLEADELDPDNPDLKHELALVLMELGEYDKSLEWLWGS